MSRRSLFRVLWLAMLVCVPVPFFLVETGREPVAAIVVMLAFVLQLIAAEGSAGAIGLAAWMLAVQALVACVVLALVAGAVTRGLEKQIGRRSAPVVLALVALMLAFAWTQPIYRTPFREAGLHATLGQVFK